MIALAVMVFLFIAAVLVSISLFVGLLLCLIPTVIIFFIFMLLGFTITFWKLYLTVFLAIFVCNLLFSRD